MDPGDQQVVASMAAKAANMAVAGHESAKHAAPVDEATPELVSAKPAGFLQDGQGNGSSKRLESFIALGIAAVVAVLGVILVPGHLVEVAAVAGAFLTYSLAMQGVSAASERNMP